MYDFCHPMIVQDVRIDETENDGEGRAASSDKTIHHPQMPLEVKPKNSEGRVVRQ